jgi:hypothetical protein
VHSLGALSWPNPALLLASAIGPQLGQEVDRRDLPSRGAQPRLECYKPAICQRCRFLNPTSIFKVTIMTLSFRNEKELEELDLEAAAPLVPQSPPPYSKQNPNQPESFRLQELRTEDNAGDSAKTKQQKQQKKTRSWFGANNANGVNGVKPIPRKRSWMSSVTCWVIIIMVLFFVGLFVAMAAYYALHRNNTGWQNEDEFVKK